MVDERFDYDENDEITDEEYFSGDDGREPTEDDNVQQIQTDSEDGQPAAEYGDSGTVVADEEYKVSSITPNFLRNECEIKLESSKTVIKFNYRGEQFKGIVLQKMNDDNYIFLVKPVGKNAKKNAEKTLKKIYIPDAELV